MKTFIYAKTCMFHILSSIIPNSQNLEMFQMSINGDRINKTWYIHKMASSLVIRLSYLSLLFFETVHSNGYIFLFLLFFSLLFSSQLFVRLPQTAILLFCISSSGWRSWYLSPVQCHKPLSIVLQALCLSDLIP